MPTDSAATPRSFLGFDRTDLLVLGGLAAAGTLFSLMAQWTDLPRPQSFLGLFVKAGCYQKCTYYDQHPAHI